MRTYTSDISKFVGKKVSLEGWVHKIRKLGGITFLVLRDASGLAQAVVEKTEANKILAELSTESVIKLVGKVVKEDRAPGGAEIHTESVEVISKVTEELPIEINKKELNINLDTNLDWRPLTLRNPKQRAIFKVQSQILRSFRDYLISKNFTEISTPKIVEEGLETGGAEMYELKWFNKKAYLSQSPQMYKQIMVGVFERVFETAYIYRAEKHNTSRHLNEYLSMDLEMGFIESYEDIMDLEEEYLKQLIRDLNEYCMADFEINGAEIPKINKKIPRLTLAKAQEILKESYQEDCIGEPDLDPNQEKKICEYSKEKLESEFIFITHYPSKKRPFYVMNDPKNLNLTLSFDLLFRGIEITTGGQRINEYKEYIEKLKSRGMNPKKFEDYLMVFKYGMPLHGGLAIGAERLTAKLLNLENVREASLFPRDMQRLRP